MLHVIYSCKLTKCKEALPLIVRYPTTTNGGALSAIRMSSQEGDSCYMTLYQVAVGLQLRTLRRSRDKNVMPHNSPWHNSRLGNHIIGVCCAVLTNNLGLCCEHELMHTKDGANCKKTPNVCQLSRYTDCLYRLCWNFSLVRPNDVSRSDFIFYLWTFLPRIVIATGRPSGAPSKVLYISG